MGGNYDDIELCGTDVVQYLRDSDDDIWKKFQQDEKRIAKLVAQGKQWEHTGPKCGETFQNNAPEKNQLCLRCGEEAIRDILDTRYEEIWESDMEREPARWSSSSFERELERFKRSGHFIDPQEPEKWVKFWYQCEKNDKAIESSMKDKYKSYSRNTTWHKCPRCGIVIDSNQPQEGLCDKCNDWILRQMALKAWLDDTEGKF